MLYAYVSGIPMLAIALDVVKAEAIYAISGKLRVRRRRSDRDRALAPSDRDRALSQRP